ncbi:MAG: AIR synthase family protein [Anaerolineae bacterium]|jgi:hydrogenase maturation factor
MNAPYALGKLPPEHLARLFDRYPSSNRRVVLGPGIGHDAAVISFCEGDGADGKYLVAKADPITFATDEIGWYAVHVNANDVACTGATPRWFLATLLLPQAETDEALVDDIFDQIARTCEELDIALVGGHTEITHGFSRPVVGGFMLGEVPPNELVRPDGARPGDVLMLTKGVAVEGTALIARERGEHLHTLEPSLIQRSRDFLHDPGISVVRDAAIAVDAGDVHAMHDPTEGGLAMGLWEMAEASRVGLVVDGDAIPVFEETRTLCRELSLDPMGLIGSGALVVAVAPGHAADVQAALEAEGIPAAQIGVVVEREEGTVLRDGGGERPLPRFERDEITRLFE